MKMQNLLTILILVSMLSAFLILLCFLRENVIFINAELIFAPFFVKKMKI